LAPDKYKTINITSDSQEVIEPWEWVAGLEKTDILNFLYILYFGRSVEINICVNLLRGCILGGFLWLDRLVSIDTKIIVWITKSPSVGEDPLPLFTYKLNEKELAERMKDKYDTFIGVYGLDITSINDDTVRFTMKVLAYNLLRKYHKDQVPIGVIAAVE